MPDARRWITGEKVKVRHALTIVAIVTGLIMPEAPASAQPAEPSSFAAPAEFEPQEYIWLTWMERGWLGGPPFSDVSLNLMRLLTPHVKVRLLFSSLTPDDPSYFGPHRLTQAEAEDRLRKRLEREGVDLSRVELIYHPQPIGAIQDPGPYFLRSADGKLAIADYGYDHPSPAIEALDRDIAARLGLPTVPSPIVSEGGGRQVNGRGTLLLVESVELARNPGWTRDDIEREHKRVLGATNVIWLKKGPADEESGRLSDGRWGIGTGGHVDVFARFADAGTILLAQVDERDRDASPIARETHERMEENFRILSAARDEAGRPFRIVRIPVPDLSIAKASYDALSTIERSWFEGAKADEVIEFYLPGGYLNFIIANDIVVTARFWRDGAPDSQREKDRRAQEALQRAFPGRRVVQIDALALLYDGGGLHCYSRNQPMGLQPARPAP
jgi:agmatine deiminase